MQGRRSVSSVAEERKGSSGTEGRGLKAAPQVTRVIAP